jgi:hypothetical protein
MELNKLSLEEIREQLLRGDQPITAHFLNKLGRDPRQGARKIYELLRKRYEKERTDRVRVLNMLNFERVLWKSGVQSVAGIDEVGIGPLAGPVVAAAVVFPPGTELAGIDDSKRLDIDQRVKMEAVIRHTATAIGVGLAEVGEIDRLNIYHAALLAMRRAVEALPVKPDHLLIDARTIPDISIPRTLSLKATGSTSRSLPHRLSPKRIETDSWKIWKRNIRDMVSLNIRVMAPQSIRTPSANWDLVPSIECLFPSFESFVADFQSCFMSLNKNWRWWILPRDYVILRRT